MTVISTPTEEKKEIIRIRDAFKEMHQPNVFDGRAYCVRVSNGFGTINARRNIARSMPYSGAYLGRINGNDGLYIIVDAKEKEEIDRYPIPYIEKRFRDTKGALAIQVNDLISTTRGEALEYYKPNMLYLVRGKPAILMEYKNGCVFHTQTRNLHTTPRGELGLFLPDVSNYGQEIIQFNDKRYLTANMQRAISNEAKSIVIRPPARVEMQHAR